MKKWRLIYLVLLLSVVVLPCNAQAGPVGFTKIATGVTTLTFTDTSCPDNTTCYYYVTAVDSIGAESNLSNEATGSIPNSGTHTVTLTWVASTSPNVTYNVYQHIGPLPVSVKATVS